MSKVLIQGDWLDGFSSGKKAALLDWEHRKGKREFAILCSRLRALKWARENPERMRVNHRRYLAKPGVRERRLVQTKLRKRAARIANGMAVFTCELCSATWCKAPWTKGPKPRFCGPRCYARHRYATDEGFRERAKASARATKRRSAV